jgi:hypothetical protein
MICGGEGLVSSLRHSLWTGVVSLVGDGFGLRAGIDVDRREMIPHIMVGAEGAWPSQTRIRKGRFEMRQDRMGTEARTSPDCHRFEASGWMASRRRLSRFEAINERPRPGNCAEREG